MKKLFFGFLFLPYLAHAGTITTSFNPLGTIVYSSAVAPPTAVIFDAYVSTVPGSGSSPVTFNLTVGSCGGRFLAVGCGMTNSDTVTGMTVGGNAMTLSTSSIDSVYGTAIYTYIAPASGSQAIAVSMNSGIATRVACAAASFCNVSQSAPVDVSTATFEYPSAAFSTSTLVTTALGDALFDVLTDGNADTVSPSQSGQAALLSNTRSSNTIAVSTRTTTTAGSYDMGWSGITGNPHTTTSIGIKSVP